MRTSRSRQHRPRFRFYQDVAGEWRWRLVASNGREVASGESHSTKSHAKRAARTLKETAKRAVIE